MHLSLLKSLFFQINDFFNHFITLITIDKSISSALNCELIEGLENF